MQRSRATEYTGFSVNFVSTWFPRKCGIATFTEHTIRALDLYEDDIKQIKIHPIDKNDLTYHYPIREKHIISQMDSSSWIDAAEIIIGRFQRNKPKGIKTIAVLQHEYGLDGNGRDNNYNEIARRLKEADVPNVVVLHTVLTNPNNYQRNVIQQFGENCDKLICITPSCREILKEVYALDESKIVHIPHGVPELKRRMSSRDAREKWGLHNRIVVSTLGFMSESKGIRYGIRGFSKFLQKIEPRARKRLVYLIVGETNPEELEKKGQEDPYRKKLIEIAEDEGLNPVVLGENKKLDYPESSVIFLNKYLMTDEHIELIKATHAILLPYVNPDQVSSGNLAYSIGLETPVVATKFRHARDTFSDAQGKPDGSGVLVGLKNDDEIARGLRQVFENLVEIGTKAYKKGSAMRWSVIGKQYLNLFYDVALKKSEIERAKIPFLNA